jgi:hypothetical protein
MKKSRPHHHGAASGKRDKGSDQAAKSRECLRGIAELRDVAGNRVTRVRDRRRTGRESLSAIAKSAAVATAEKRTLASNW